MTDEIAAAFGALLPGAAVRRGGIRRDCRMVRWVEVAGPGPVVLFESGAGATSLTWLPVIRDLARQGSARLVAYDRAGIGASDPPGGSWRSSVGTQVGDLIAVLAEMSSGGGLCILVAHSWGGLLARAAARSRPDLVAGLVLVDPSDPGVLRQVPRRVRYAMLLRQLRATARACLGLGQRSLADSAAAWAAGLSEDPLVRAQLAAADMAYYAGLRRLFAIQLGETRTAYSSAAEMQRRCGGDALPAVPLVVLSADPDAAPGQVSTLARKMTAQHRDLVAQVPGARHELVRQAGHFIQMDASQTVARAISEVVDGALKRRMRNARESA